MNTAHNTYDCQKNEAHTCNNSYTKYSITFQDSWAEIILLAMGGAYFFKLIQTGNLANYVNIRFSWLVTFGSIAFFILATAKLLPLPAEHNHNCAATTSNWRFLLLCLPVALGFALPSTPLGASVITSTPDVTTMIQESGMQYLLTPEAITNRDSLYSLYDAFTPQQPRSLENTLDFTILDWFQVYYDLPQAERKEVLSGMPVNVIGFAYNGSNSLENSFILTRFFMRHCMFDTTPLGLPVLLNTNEMPTEDTWLRIQGNVQFVPNSLGKEVLTIVPETIEGIKQPEIPYLYSTASR